MLPVNFMVERTGKTSQNSVSQLISKINKKQNSHNLFLNTKFKIKSATAERFKEKYTIHLVSYTSYGFCCKEGQIKLTNILCFLPSHNSVHLHRHHTAKKLSQRLLTLRRISNEFLHVQCCISS